MAQYGAYGPFGGAAAVTPHDTNAQSTDIVALYVGGAGNITLRTEDRDTDVLFTGVPVGTILPVKATHVRATGTTATAIVALF